MRVLLLLLVAAALVSVAVAQVDVPAQQLIEALEDLQGVGGLQGLVNLLGNGGLPALGGLPGLAALGGLPGLGGVVDLAGLEPVVNMAPVALTAIDSVKSGANALLAGTGLAIIEVAVLVGFIFNYLEQVEKANEAAREEKLKAAEEAAAMEAAEAEAPERSFRTQYSRWQPAGHPQAPRSPYPQPFQQSSVFPYSQYPARRRRRQQRSLGQPPSAALTEVAEEEGAALGRLEEAARQAVGLLDRDGCLLKLLCHLHYQRGPHAPLTPEEATLTRLFPRGPPFTACRTFPRCLVGPPELDGLLTQAWKHRNTLL